MGGQFIPLVDTASGEEVYLLDQIKPTLKEAEAAARKAFRKMVKPI